MRVESEETTKELNSLIGGGDFESLLRAAEGIIDADPGSYIGYWWRGRALTLQGRLDEAVKAFIDSVKHAEDDQEESRVMASLVNVYNLMKDYGQALDYSKVALELDPANPAAILARGVALAAAGRGREASELISSNWGRLRNSYERACGYAVTRQKAKMLEAFKEDLASNPHHGVTALHDPEFKPYLGSPEFRAILKTAKVIALDSFTSKDPDENNCTSRL